MTQIESESDTLWLKPIRDRHAYIEFLVNEKETMLVKIRKIDAELQRMEKVLTPDVSPDYYTMTLRPFEKQLLLDAMKKCLSDQADQGFSAERLKKTLTRIDELENMK